MPRVLNTYRDATDGTAKRITWPTRWANPFDNVPAYTAWIYAQPALIDAAQRELAGHDLICCCAPAACHGDVLLQIANFPRGPNV